MLGISETKLFAADFGTETRGTPDFDAVLRLHPSELESFTTKLDERLNNVLRIG